MLFLVQVSTSLLVDAKGIEQPAGPPDSSTTERGEQPKTQTLDVVTLQNYVLQLPSGELWVMPKGTITVAALGDEMSSRYGPYSKLLEAAYLHPGKMIPLGYDGRAQTYSRTGFLSIQRSDTSNGSLFYDKASRQFVESGPITYIKDVTPVVAILLAVNVIGLIVMFCMMWDWVGFIGKGGPRIVAVPIALFIFAFTNWLYGQTVSDFGYLRVVSASFFVVWFVATVGTSINCGRCARSHRFAYLKWPALLLFLYSSTLALFGKWGDWGN